MAKVKRTEVETITPAIYLRVSTEEQADSGLGIDAQLTRCTAMAIAKGWADPVIFKDEGISGTIPPGPKRPDLARLMAAVERNEVQAVIVLDLSRLARSVRVVTSLIDLFDQSGISFVSCKENFDTSTAMGKAMLGIVAVFGQLERDLTSERTIAALGERKKRHGYSSGKLPLGYTRDSATEQITIDESAAPVVRTIFEYRNTGDTMKMIADRMTDTTGKQWYASSVKAILDNKQKYTGDMLGFPAII